MRARSGSVVAARAAGTRRCAPAALCAAILAAAAGPAAGRQDAGPPDPAVVVWYRGVPAGRPRLDDLAAIRALGFAGVAWPARFAAGRPELDRLAAAVDLAVVARGEPRPLTAASALAPGVHADVAAGDPWPAALAWRALAHGARVVAFDAGAPEGAGVAGPGGATPGWVPAAVGVARVVAANRELVRALGPAPAAVFVEAAAPAGLDVALRAAPRAWVVVATHTGATRARARVRLSRDVPYALWVSLVDGAALAMLGGADGPTWTLELDPGGVAAYIIDRTLR